MQEKCPKLNLLHACMKQRLTEMVPSTFLAPKALPPHSVPDWRRFERKSKCGFDSTDVFTRSKTSFLNHQRAGWRTATRQLFFKCHLVHPRLSFCQFSNSIDLAHPPRGHLFLEIALPHEQLVGHMVLPAQPAADTEPFLLPNPLWILHPSGKA